MPGAPHTALLLGLLVLACLRHNGGTSRIGSHFVTGFLDSASSQKPLLLVVPHLPEAVNVTVRMPADPGFDPIHRTINGTMTYIELPASVRMSTSKRGHQGVLVEATSDVILYAVNRVNGSDDAFLALPTSGLGAEYYVTSYRPAAHRKSVPQVGVIAVSDVTHIAVTLPATLETPAWYSGSDLTYRAGETFNVTLGECGSVVVESESDLSGVHVRASLPVVVLSGNAAPDAADLNGDADGDAGTDAGSDAVPPGLTDQMLPSTTWGRTFATVPFAGTAGSTFKVIAAHNDTSIQVRRRAGRHQEALSPPQHTHVTLQGGDDYIHITTTKPVLVLQYIHLATSGPPYYPPKYHPDTSGPPYYPPQYRDTSGPPYSPPQYQDTSGPPYPVPQYHQDASGPPYSPPQYPMAALLLLLPPIEQRRKHYVFSHSGDSGSPSGRRERLVHLVVGEAERDQLRLDGEQLGNDSRVLIEGVGANYSALRLTVGGRHNLSHQTPGVAFSAMSYGLPLDYGHLRQRPVTTGQYDPPAHNINPLGTHSVKSASVNTSHQTSTQSTTSSSTTTVATSSHPPSTPSPSPAHTPSVRTVVKAIVLSSDRKSNTINEAAAAPRPFSAPPGGGGGGGLSPTVVAVIVSLSVAILAVIVCILGFLVAELTCRREGGLRHNKVVPFIN